MKWVYIIGGSLAAYLAVVSNYKYLNGRYETLDVVAALIGSFVGGAIIFVGIPAIIVALSRKTEK